MADDVTFQSSATATPPSGTVVAGDLIAGVVHQRVKISQGADGFATDVSSTDPLQVTVANTGANATAIKVDGSAVTQPVSDASGSLTVDDGGLTLSVDDGASSLTVDNAALSVTGGGLEATALRVTLASDSTGVVSVDDNGGNLSIDDGGNSITVDYATTGSGTATGALRVELPTNGTGVIATVGAVTSITNVVQVGDNSSSLTVDNAGTFAVQATVAAGATNIAKAEDAASADADVGVPAMAVRKATPANTSGLDGDYEMLQMSAGRLWASATIDAALPSGTNAIGKLAANSGVDIGDVDVTSIIPGTAATSLGKAEDAAHTTGDTGVMALAVRANTLAASSGTDGDYETIKTDTNGALWVRHNDSVAHDAADAGNGIKITAKAETSPKGITTVADADRTDLYADADGMLMVKLNTSLADLVSERVSDTAGTSAAFTNFSAVASTKNYVTSIVVYNTSATGGYVDFRDGTAGSVLWTMPLPATSGAVISSPFPLFKTSANTALAYDVSAALTTVYISVSGFQSKL